MKTLLIPSLVGTLCLSVLPAVADVAVSFVESAPTENIIASYTPEGAGSGYQWRNDSGATPPYRALGQSFLASTNAEFSAFGLQLSGNYQSGARNANATLTVWELASINALPTTSGSAIVSTQNFVMPSLSNGAGQFLNFDIDNVQLSAGKYYLVMLSFDSEAATRNLVFRSYTGNPYADGAAYNAVYTGSAEDATLGYTRMDTDLSFYIQATPVIPEPGAALLLLPFAALAATLVVRRRNRRKA